MCDDVLIWMCVYDRNVVPAQEVLHVIDVVRFGMIIKISRWWYTMEENERH